MSRRRIVVTGLGAVTPLGLNVSTTWNALIEGQSGVCTIDSFDASDYACQIAATVKNFDGEAAMGRKDIRKNDVFIQYGVAAAIEAITHAGLDSYQGDLTRIGVSIGSGIGGLTFIEKNHREILDNGPRRVSPSFIPGAIINMISGNVSIKYGFKGPNLATVTACTTGTHNIGLGARLIAYGDADVMVVGGAEKASTPLGIGGFSACRALSTRNEDPTKASRPWDKDRDGFVLGDGAGVLVLEEYEHAKARGAIIYAELSGFGASGDAYHITRPVENGEGASRCMQAALADAKINRSEINHINAHATSTPAGDELENTAVCNTFGEHAANIAMSGTKSMTGHLLGAAGAVEAIFTVKAIETNIAPPTINLNSPSQGCNLNYVANTAQERPIDVALSNSFGFGGTNGSLVFKKI